MTEKTTEVGKAAAEVADVVHEKVAIASDFAFDKMSDYFEAAKQVIEQYGGDVAALGLNVLRIDAASQVLLPLISASLAAFTFYKVWNYKIQRHPANVQAILDAININYGDRLSSQDRLLSTVFNITSNQIHKGDSYYVDLVKDKESMPATGVWRYSELSEGSRIGTVVGLGGLATLFGICLTKLVNVWAWVGIFYPELYAVHKFLL